MEEQKKLKLAQRRCGASDDELSDVADYMESAKSYILSLRHPFSDDPDSEAWEPRYDSLQVDMCVEMWDRRGAEGEITNSQNGITRTYAASVMSPQLVRRVVPKGRAV